MPLGHAADDAAICRAIIALGYNLGLGILAEGVSSQVQLEFLRAEVCDAVQGFLMSQAVPANEFAEIMRRQPRSTVEPVHTADAAHRQSWLTPFPLVAQRPEGSAYLF